MSKGSFMKRLIIVASMIMLTTSHSFGMESASTNIHNHFWDDTIMITNSQPRSTGPSIIQPGKKETIYFHPNNTELFTTFTMHSEALQNKSINLRLPYPPQKDIYIMKCINKSGYTFIRVVCDNKPYGDYSSK